MTTARVLILDDDTAVLQTLVALVEHAGHEARATVDPHTFFGLHRTWRPTHLVIDLRMPQMDGVDVLAQLADEDCEASIVIASGVGGRVLDAARRFAAENGLRIAGVLAKPFTLLALAPLLDREGEPATHPVGHEPSTGPSAGDLAAALDDVEQLHVAYQPKVTAQGQRLTGFEVLARWQHPTLGAVSPAHFVPLAEREGLIDRLTARVVDLALPWFASLHRPALSLAVNLSAQVAGDRAFPGHLEERCRRHVVEPGAVILELTETASAEDANEALGMLTRMRVRGFQLSLDDYGTGYSSMSQLARLPFTEIKIDRSFVMTSRVSRESRLLVASVVDLGRSLGLTTVAEGVEDAAALDLLATLGCDLVQGFHVARPMPAEDAARWAVRSQA